MTTTLSALTSPPPAPSMPAQDRLTHQHAQCNLDTLRDSLALTISNVESACLRAGGVPGADYTFRDLVGWALTAVRFSTTLGHELETTDERRTVPIGHRPVVISPELREIVEGKRSLRIDDIYALLEHRGLRHTPSPAEIRRQLGALGWTSRHEGGWLVLRAPEGAV